MTLTDRIRAWINPTHRPAIRTSTTPATIRNTGNATATGGGYAVTGNAAAPNYDRSPLFAEYRAGAAAAYRADDRTVTIPREAANFAEHILIRLADDHDARNALGLLYDIRKVVGARVVMSDAIAASDDAHDARTEHPAPVTRSSAAAVAALTDPATAGALSALDEVRSRIGTTSPWSAAAVVLVIDQVAREIIEVVTDADGTIRARGER